MKKLLILVIALLSVSYIGMAGNLKFIRFHYPTALPSDDTTRIRVEYSNINSMYAVTGIKYNLSVMDTTGRLVYTQSLSADSSFVPLQNKIIDFGMLDYARAKVGRYTLEVSTTQDYDEDPSNNTGTMQIEVTPALGSYDYFKQRVTDYLLNNYSGELDRTVVYFNNSRSMLSLQSFDNSVSYESNSEEWFALIDWDAYTKFEKPVSYYIYNPELKVDSVMNASWYPKINGVSWAPYTPFETNNPYVLNLGDANDLPVDSLPISNTPSTEQPRDSVCVIIVTGVGERPIVEESFGRDAVGFQDLLTTGKYGERVKEENVHVLSYGSKDEIIDKIREMKDSCKHIYFVYSGHGSKNGNGSLCTNDEPENWLGYTQLFDELFKTNAEEVSVIIDACYSGLAIEAAKNSPNRNGKKIDIFTSTDSARESKIQWTIAKPSEEIIGRGFFMKNFIMCSNDSLADKNKDGFVSAEEAFDCVRMRNPYLKLSKDSINNLQNPQKYVEDNTQSTASVEERLKYWTEYYFAGSIMPGRTLGYFVPTPMGVGQKIYPRFDRDNELPVTDASYAGWIVFDSHKRLQTNLKVFTYDAKEDKFNYTDGAWYPVIEDMTGNISYTNDKKFYGTFDLPDVDMESTISEVATGNKEKKDCVLLVSGVDGKDATQQKAFEKDVDDVKNNLMNEQFGAKISEENIRVEKGITKDSLLKILEEMKGKCNKVIFFYSGHGGSDGDMCLADKTENLSNSDEWLSYRDLMKKLSEIGADEYEIILDACYSGHALDVLKDSEVFKDADVTVITSTDKETEATSEFFGSDGGDVEGNGAFTRRLMEYYGNKDADENKDSTVTLEEAFRYFKLKKPKTIYGEDLDSLQKPGMGLKRNGKVEDEKINFTDNDVKLFNVDGKELTYDYVASMLINSLQNLSIADNRIIELSASRMWSIEAEGADNMMNVDLQFALRPQFESIVPATDNILGMCWREDENDDWKPYYPSVYNSTDNTIYCSNVNHFSDWVVGVIVKEGGSSVEEDLTDEDIIYSPNPFKNALNISYTLKDGSMVSVEIVDVTGKRVDGIAPRYMSAGDYTFTFDGSKYARGTYYCNIVTAMGSKTIKLVKE